MAKQKKLLVNIFEPGAERIMSQLRALRRRAGKKEEKKEDEGKNQRKTRGSRFV